MSVCSVAIWRVTIPLLSCIAVKRLLRILQPHRKYHKFRQHNQGLSAASSLHAPLDPLYLFSIFYPYGLIRFSYNRFFVKKITFYIFANVFNYMARIVNILTIINIIIIIIHILTEI